MDEQIIVKEHVLKTYFDEETFKRYCHTGCAMFHFDDSTDHCICKLFGKEFGPDDYLTEKPHKNCPAKNNDTAHIKLTINTISLHDKKDYAKMQQEEKDRLKKEKEDKLKLEKLYEERARMLAAGITKELNKEEKSIVKERAKYNVETDWEKESPTKKFSDIPDDRKCLRRKS